MIEAIIGGMLLFILARECLFWRTTHKLIDKLMSRNYYDYEISQSVAKQTIQEPKPEIKLDTINEDLTELNNIIQ